MLRLVTFKILLPTGSSHRTEQAQFRSLLGEGGVVLIGVVSVSPSSVAFESGTRTKVASIIGQ